MASDPSREARLSGLMFRGRLKLCSMSALPCCQQSEGISRSVARSDGTVYERDVTTYGIHFGRTYGSNKNRWKISRNESTRRSTYTSNPETPLFREKITLGPPCNSAPSATLYFDRYESLSLPKPKRKTHTVSARSAYVLSVPLAIQRPFRF